MIYAVLPFENIFVLFARNMVGANCTFRKKKPLQCERMVVTGTLLEATA
jgi:hypothetical protein